MTDLGPNCLQKSQYQPATNVATSGKRVKNVHQYNELVFKYKVINDHCASWQSDPDLQFQEWVICLFELLLYVPLNHYSVMLGQVQF